MPPGMSPRAELGLLLRMAHRKAARAFGQALAPLGLEGRHFGVLLTLAGQGPMIQSRLISELHSDKSAMVRTVDDLEGQGLVTRTLVPGDRRARAVTITDLGRERLAEARVVANSAGEKIFDHIDDTDLATLLRLLRGLIDQPDT